MGQQQQQGQVEEALGSIGKTLDRGINRISGFIDKVKNLDKPNPDNINSVLRLLDVRSTKTASQEDAEVMRAAASCIRTLTTYLDRNGAEKQEKEDSSR